MDSQFALGGKPRPNEIIMSPNSKFALALVLNGLRLFFVGTPLFIAAKFIFKEKGFAPTLIELQVKLFKVYYEPYTSLISYGLPFLLGYLLSFMLHHIYKNAGWDWLPFPELMDLNSNQESPTQTNIHNSAQWKVGDRCFAVWPSDGLYYSGCIKDRKSQEFFILFDDNQTAWVPRNKIAELFIYDGLRVSCRWRGETGYYPCTVKKFIDDKILVLYDSGETEWTTVALIRTKI